MIFYLYLILLSFTFCLLPLNKAYAIQTLQFVSDRITTQLPSASQLIKAMHTIGFTTVSTIPVSGSITIRFPQLVPGDKNNPQGASASTFQLNNISGNVRVWDSTQGSDITGSFSIVANNPNSSYPYPTIVLTLTGSATVPTNHALKVFLGCTGITNGNCLTQVPSIISPTKNALNGTADTWKIYVVTRDVTNSYDLDAGRAVIATIEPGSLTATVEPTFTFTIMGLSNGTNFNNIPSCSYEITNSGIGSIATNVNLGNLGSNITIAGQEIIISTNATNGYSLTATSNGYLTNRYYSIKSSTNPQAMKTGVELFGIHPCGADVDLSFNPSSSILSGGLVSYPTSNNSILIAKRSMPANSISTGIEYGITVSDKTPAGIYNSVITYTATPMF